MRRWSRLGVAAAGGVAASAAAAAALGTAAWERETARAVKRLVPERPRDAAAGEASPRFDPARLEGLPAPVARYLAFALGDAAAAGDPLPRRARVRHIGEFATTPGAWRPFTSVEHLASGPPGFVWDAKIRMAPLVTVRVRDSYLRGEGAMRARAAAGIVPVVSQGGTPAMAEASLQRYLAEAVWMPAALLPDAGVVWTPIDDATARATLADRGVTATVDFHFGNGGEVVGTSAVRFRDVNGTPVATAWVGRHGDYARLAGMMVPTSGEVAWVLADGTRLPYWRGRIAGVEYDPVPSRDAWRDR